MIRKFCEYDRDTYISMADEFYHSSAVDKPVDKSHFENAFDEMMKSEVYAQGYMFVYNDECVGFCVTAKTYSVEAGGIVIWIEDLYVREKFRSVGLGKEFLSFIEKNGDDNLKRLRLEIEDENERAISLYEKMGFVKAPYNNMWKEI